MTSQGVLCSFVPLVVDCDWPTSLSNNNSRLSIAAGPNLSHYKEYGLTMRSFNSSYGLLLQSAAQPPDLLTPISGQVSCIQRVAVIATTMSAPGVRV